MDLAAESLEILADRLEPVASARADRDGRAGFGEA
jgi:hypothetical protein